MTQSLTISVLGGGSFGTAIANIIATNNHKTYLWMRDAKRSERCQKKRENTEYLPNYPLSDNLIATADLAEAVSASDLVFISVPSGSVRLVAKQLAPLLRKDAMVVTTTKGIELSEGGFKLMSQVLEQELPDNRIAVISGPNFASEIVQKMQTGTVVASDHREVCDQVQAVLCSDTFRVYTNRDKYGVELGGALKNIYAIISGMAVAVGAGQNTQAMLLTRSLAEMGRFAQTMGADPMTFLGLAGVGDLILTCSSNLSRNYRVGFAIGQGKKLEAIVAELGQVAEGVNTVKVVKQKADELGVYMPLLSGLHAVLFEECAIASVVKSLMLGEQASDIDYLEK